MTVHLRHHLSLAVNRQGVFGRRDFLRGITASALAAGAVNWTDVMSLRADDLRRDGRACILLWMQGGPSQLETFDPKPDHANGGETKAIDTAVSGIRISENLPHVARTMNDFALIRSMTTKEGNHQRASFLLHTSYVPTASVSYPTMGAVAAQQISHADCDLPAFVRIGARFPNAGNGGFLGNTYNAFIVSSAERPPDNTTPAGGESRYRRRLALLDELESGPSVGVGAQQVAEHRKLYGQASSMVLSEQMHAFDVERESASARERYGRSEFGTGCLLARRLVESGVTFVEVGLNNWDTHDDNFNRCRTLSESLDQPMAALVTDLKERGMLDRTLVVWMGEFGRTPRINPRGGRDHFPRAFSAVLAGGGIRGGQVIGATDAAGESVADRPVSEKDLFCSIYRSLGIEPSTQNMSPIGRPIKLVDGGAAVDELFA